MVLGVVGGGARTVLGWCDGAMGGLTLIVAHIAPYPPSVAPLECICTHSSEVRSVQSIDLAEGELLGVVGRWSGGDVCCEWCLVVVVADDEEKKKRRIELLDRFFVSRFSTLLRPAHAGWPAGSNFSAVAGGHQWQDSASLLTVRPTRERRATGSERLGTCIGHRVKRRPGCRRWRAARWLQAVEE